MEKLKFTTATGSIELKDTGHSAVGSSTVKELYLYDADVNSVAITANTVKCLDMDGQHTISTNLNPRTIAITLTFNGISEGRDTDATMLSLRRTILKYFPLGINGELQYTNDGGTYYITAHAIEYPNIERQVGTLCKATFYLVADYPYWHRTVITEPFPVDTSADIIVGVFTEGDLDSPVVINLECTTAITGNTDGIFFRIDQTEGGSSKLYIVKNLAVGEKLVINTGLNNEVYCHHIAVDGTVTNANHYVDYRNSDMLRNNVGATAWRYHIGGTAGVWTAGVDFQNIYRSV